MTAEDICNILQSYFPNPSIPLKAYHINPFVFLISVLLSAQCTDKKVN